MRVSFIRNTVAFGLTVGVLVVSAVGTSAQTSRSKPRPLATPPPVLTEAEIISRADEPPVVVPTPVETPSAGRPGSGGDGETNSSPARSGRRASGQGSSFDEQQKRLLLNLDILTRAEQRIEGLRKQQFDLIEKENSIKSRLEQIEIDLRPEMIERALQLAGSMKPEEVRANRRRVLEAERSSLQTLLTDVQNTHSNLNTNLQKAEVMADRLRLKLEKDIDDSFLNDPDNK